MPQILLPIFLISFRLAPIFLIAPISSFRRVPLMVRIIFIFILSLLFNATLPQTMILENGPSLWAMCFTEFLIGSSLAFSFHAASGAVQTMGQLVDIQMGFAAAAMFDPSTEQMISPTGEILTLTLLVSLITLNIHHDVILGLAKLFEILPPGSAIHWNSQWLKILGVHFVIGFIIVSPIILTLWFTDLTLAFISRSLPQAPIYFVGLPVKIGVGILMLGWFSRNALEPFLRLLTESLESWNLMFDV